MFWEELNASKSFPCYFFLINGLIQNILLSLFESGLKVTYGNSVNINKLLLCPIY